MYQCVTAGADSRDLTRILDVGAKLRPVTTPVQSNSLSALQLSLLQKMPERSQPGDPSSQDAKLPPRTPNASFTPVGRGRFIDIVV